MKILSTFLFLSVNFSFAQQRQLTNDSDTTFWFDWRTELTREIGLTTIDKSTQDYEFRFWDGYKVVRLWKNAGLLQSEVIFFLREHKEKKGDYEERLYHSGLKLDQESTNAIKYLIGDLEILDIPSDSKIDDWKQGLDGITYIIETSNKTSFTFKNYWTPTSFPNVKEARFIQYFVNEVNSLKPIKDGFQRFMSKQPFERYYAGVGSGVIATVIE